MTFETETKSINVQIQDKLAATILVVYYPALVNDKLVDRVLDDAAVTLGNCLAKELNEYEEKKQ